MNVSLVTLTSGREYITFKVHTIGDCVNMDYYPGAYSVWITDIFKACSQINIDPKKLIEKEIESVKADLCYIPDSPAYDDERQEAESRILKLQELLSDCITK